jgi:hypothetical protein
MIRRAVAVGLVAVLGAACSSSDPTPDPSTAPTASIVATTSPAVASSTAVASTTSSAAVTSNAVTIGAEVLGDNGTVRDVTASIDAVDAKLIDLCPSIGRRRIRYHAERRNRVVVKERQPLPTISDDLSIFAESNAAADVFNAYASAAMIRCYPKLAGGSGLALGGVTTQRVPIDDVGDAAAAIRLRGTSVVGGLATQVTTELIVVQRGVALHVIVATWSDLFPLTATQRRAIVQAAGA